MQSGSGKQPKLTEFQELCIGFVRAAKGDSIVDGIHGVIEPSGTNQSSLTQPKHPAKGKGKGSTSTISLCDDDDDIQPKPAKKSQKYDDEWKKGFFNSIQSIEEDRATITKKMDALKCYNLALKNMFYEKQLCKFRYHVEISLHFFSQNSCSLKHFSFLLH